MKRRICAGILAVLCAVSALLAGCGKNNDVSKIERKGKSSSEGATSSEESDSKASSKGSDEKSSKKEESSNGAEESSSKVEKPVETRPPVDYNVSGWYGFTINGFNQVYSNEELQECFDRIQEICNDANFSMGFSYKNVNTGAYVGYNQYNRYLTCSTLKAPYAKSLLVKGIDLDTQVTRNYVWPGDTGTVVDAPYGTVYTARELIELAILESDNSAYYMLCKTFGTDVFNQTQYSLGSGYTLGYYGDWIFTYCTSDDMMKDFEDIYWFAEENEQGRWLIDLMSNTKMNMQITQALGDEYRVAHKYGSEFNEITFNDCAIVYADSPFVLCIFTKQYPETEESCKVFRELALEFDKINSLIADDTIREDWDYSAEISIDKEESSQSGDAMESSSQVFSMENAWW